MQKMIVFRGAKPQTPADMQDIQPYHGTVLAHSRLRYWVWGQIHLVFLICLVLVPRSCKDSAGISVPGSMLQVCTPHHLALRNLCCNQCLAPGQPSLGWILFLGSDEMRVALLPPSQAQNSLAIAVFLGSRLFSATASA